MMTKNRGSPESESSESADEEDHDDDGDCRLGMRAMKGEPLFSSRLPGCDSPKMSVSQLSLGFLPSLTQIVAD
jgi:hypothetical protein